MSLWKIAWRSIQQRGLASFLTSLSMALGVMLVVSVLAVHGVVATSFRSTDSLGYNMIVGPNKGGKLQITLNTVYYLSEPAENFPYEFYLEFLPQAQRDAELKLAIRTQADETRSQAAQLQTLAASGAGLGGPGLFGNLLTTRVLERAAKKQLDTGRDGKYSQFTKLVIPVCLGDYFGNFRVVGTTPAMFEELRFGEGGKREYEFSAGRNFEQYNDEHGYFEAVVGAAVKVTIDQQAVKPKQEIFYLREQIKKETNPEQVKKLNEQIEVQETLIAALRERKVKLGEKISVSQKHSVSAQMVMRQMPTVSLSL